MANSLQFDIEAVNKASSTLGSVSQEVEKVGRSAKTASESSESGFSKFAASIVTVNQGLDLASKGLSTLSNVVTAPIAGFQSLLGVSFSLVQSYDKQIRGVTQLEGSMRSQGQFTAELSAEFQDFASSMQAVTTVGDEELLPLIGRLGAFVGFSDQLKDATKAALDLSAGFGISLESAFAKFIKAAQSGTLELAEGVSVQLKATDTAGRLAEAIEVVNGKFGGLAQAVAKQGFGPVQQLLNLVVDLREGLGERIAESPDFQGFVNAAKGAVQDVIDFVGANASEVSELFGAAFKASVDIAIGVVVGLVKALDLAARAAITTAAAIAEFVDSIPGIEGPTQRAVSAAQESLRSVVPAGSAGLTAFDRSALNEGLAGADTQIRAIADEFDKLTQSGNVSSASLGVLRDKLSEITTARDALAQSGGLVIQTAVDPEALDAIIAKLQQALTVIEGEPPSFLKGLQEDVIRLREAFQGTNIGDFASELLAGFPERVSSETKAAAQAAAADAGASLGALGAVGKVVTQTFEAARDAITGAGSTVGGLSDKLQEVGTTADTAGSKVKGMADSSKEAAQQAQNAIDVALGLAVKPAGVGTDAFIGDPEALVAPFEKIRNALADLGKGLNFTQQVGVVQDLSASVQDLLSSFGAGGADLALSFAQDLESDLSRIGPVSDQTRGKIQELVNAIKVVEQVRVDSLSDSIDSIDDAAGQAGESAKEAGQEVEEGFDDAAASARDAADEVRSLGSAISDLRGASVRVDASGSSGGGRDASSDIRDAARSLNDAASTFSVEISRTSSQMQGDFSRASQSLDLAASSLESGADSIETAGRNLNSAADALSSAARSFETAGRSGGGASLSSGGSLEQLALDNANRITGLENSVRDIFRTLDKIPSSAAGNIFSRPGITRIAEEGRPEAVIPLDATGARFIRSIFGSALPAGGGGSGPSQIHFAPQFDRFTLDPSQFQALLHEFSRQLGDTLQNQFSFGR